MVRINTSVNGSSLIQKLSCAVRGGVISGTLEDAGCGSGSVLVIASAPPPTARIGSQDFGQNSLNRCRMRKTWREGAAKREARKRATIILLSETTDVSFKRCMLFS